MRIGGIGFDYGNTLVSDPFEKVMRLKACDFVKTMEANGYEVAGRKFVKAWSDVNRSLNYPFCSHFAQETPLIKAVLEKLGARKKDRTGVAQQLLVSYRIGLEYVLKRDPDVAKVKAVLGELRRRKKKLMILSNERIDTLNAQLDWTGLGGFFDKVIISRKLGIEKPDPRIFRHMIRAFDLPEGRILFVGDDPERDIRPAKALGMKAVLLEQPKESAASWRNYAFELGEEEKPDFVIKSLEELLDIVE
jgi:HAD superfamily hydrolase (TIGR01509 family)